MIRLNHLALVVGNYGRSRDWYTRNLGLKVETCTLAFEVDDVEAMHRTLAARRHWRRPIG